MASARHEWIFISYRRDDTAAEAEWLAVQLRNRFSDGAVFFDKDRIEFGQDFARLLAGRVKAARIVLVMIGPDWLTCLESRRIPAAGQAEAAPDYVHLEITGALQRLGQGCEVIPVLCRRAGRGGSMPDAPALKAAGYADLGGLSTLLGPSGIDLAEAGSAELLAGGLADRIDAILDALPEGALSRANAVKTFRSQVVDILQRDTTGGIAQVWQGKGIDALIKPSACRAIVEFGNGLSEWMQDRGGARYKPDHARAIRTACSDLLGGLLGCAIDRVQAQMAVAAGTPMPTFSAGLSGAANRVGQGKTPRVGDEPEAEDFMVRRQLLIGDRNKPDPGPLAQQKAALEVRLHNLARSEKRTELSSGQKSDLPTLLQQQASQRDGPYVLTAEAATEARLQELRALAGEFNAQALAYTGGDATAPSLCLGDQRALRVAVNSCQRYIKEIR